MIYKWVAVAMLLAVAADARRITSATSSERGDAYRQWERDERADYHYFLSLANTKKRSYEAADSRYLAVRALETMKNPEAAEVLVRHLDWEYSGGEAADYAIDRYPCAQALVPMGQTVVVPLLSWFRGRHLGETEDSRTKRLELAVAVLLRLYPNDIDYGGAAEAVAIVEWYLTRLPRDGRGDLDVILDRLREAALRQPK